jgi:carbamoyl-phosphate synthase large subunit
MNFVRALTAAGHDVIPADTDELRLRGWFEWSALIPPGPLDLGWLRRTCESWGADMVHSQVEPYVAALAQRPPDFVHHFLPPVADVLMCQDKFETGIRWRRDGLREDWAQRIECDGDILDAGLKLGYPFWMRATRGAGARGATEVLTPDQGAYWWMYWRERRVDWEWIAEGFLPGRDYAWTSIWHEGRLVVSTARERLQYMYPHLAPSGRTGTPVAARIVHSEAVNTMATEAVLSVSDRPHGTYCVDLREDGDGTPRPTEINCGRFFTTSYHTAAMGVNFPDIYVRLAMGDRVPDVPQYDALPDGAVWLRHIDCPGVVIDPDGEIRSDDDLRGTSPVRGGEHQAPLSGDTIQV